jgi:hypothetical protein
MGNIHERLGTLAQRFPVQLGHAEFGDDIMDIAPRRDDTRSRFENGNDAREFLSAGARR